MMRVKLTVGHGSRRGSSTNQYFVTFRPSWPPYFPATGLACPILLADLDSKATMITFFTFDCKSGPVGSKSLL